MDAVTADSLSVRAFIRDLAAFRRENVYNPWADFDPDYDVPHASAIRQTQLLRYLSLRLSSARILLIAEACGYQGGRFTGIAMTCERMMLGFHPAVGADMVIGAPGRRTSRKDSPFLTKDIQRQKGFNEPTDTVVWEAVLRAGLGAREFLLWNIFPFHPHQPGRMLTNRTPGESELADGLSYTKKLLALTGDLPIFAIGRKSETTLSAAGYPVIGLRHPANGGANLFREGLARALCRMGLV